MQETVRCLTHEHCRRGGEQRGHADEQGGSVGVYQVLVADDHPHGGPADRQPPERDDALEEASNEGQVCLVPCCDDDLHNEPA